MGRELTGAVGPTQAHKDLPMDILKHTQRPTSSREWRSLPTYSANFTKAHSGAYYGCERRNQLF